VLFKVVVLDHYCFLFTSNDVTDILPTNCMCKLYADGLKLYASVNVGDCKTTEIHESLDVSFAWSRDWQLVIPTRNAR
jgi:hypothetical protein